jgi:hypothetical protein
MNYADGLLLGPRSSGDPHGYWLEMCVFFDESDIG